MSTTQQDATRAAEALSNARQSLERAEAAFATSATDADWSAVIVARSSIEKSERQYRILRSRADVESAAHTRKEDDADYERLIAEIEPVLTLDELTEHVRSTVVWVSKMREQEGRRARNADRLSKLLYLAEKLNRRLPNSVVNGASAYDAGGMLNSIAIAVLEALGVPLHMNAARLGLRPEAIANYSQPFLLGADTESRMFVDAVMEGDKAGFIDKMIQSVRGQSHGLIAVLVSSSDGSTFPMRFSKTIGDDCTISRQPQRFEVSSSFLQELKNRPEWPRLRVEVLNVDSPEKRFHERRSTLFKRA